MSANISLITRMKLPKYKISLDIKLNRYAIKIKHPHTGKLTIIAAIYKNDHFGILGWGIDCDDDILAGKELEREGAGKARGNSK